MKPTDAVNSMSISQLEKGGGWSVKMGFVLITLLFLASGFSSLIYQVVWTRMLVLVFGSTTFATATVLAVFMGGLALGSYIAGRLSDRIPKPFLWYGILEGIIGVWALLIPFLFDAAIPVYKIMWQSMHLSVLPFSILRFVVASFILLLPTTCMGATLPLLSKYVTKSLDYVGNRVGTLYAVNTLGAVAGAGLAGFLLLPVLGLHITTIIAALINILLCAAVVLLSKKSESGGAFELKKKEAEVSDEKLDTKTIITILAFAISGGVAMTYEVGWTRTLLLIIGSSTYAFSIMLSTFLIGIFLGSLVCAKFVDKIKDPLAWFAVLQLCICLASQLSMTFFNLVPWLNLYLSAWRPGDPNFALGVRFVVSSMTMLPLTLCLGAIFPVVIKACTKQLEKVGRSVGTAYSANTLGAIVGSVLSGFLFVPLFGVEKTMIFATALNLAVAGVLAATAPSLKKSVKIIVVAGIVPILVWIVIRPNVWDKTILLTVQSERRGMVSRPHQQMPYADWINMLHNSTDVLFWKDGASSTVGIREYKQTGTKSLVTNGHVDASDSRDMATQVLLSGYPLIWRPQAKEVCVIGWGSGVSVGVAAQFPVKQVTAIELEPAVLETHKYFKHVNHDALNDPKVKIEINDGRNYMLATNKKFDAIVSEPSNPWQAGVCNLFTREFFKICHDRLNPGGVFSLWLQMVEIPPENIKGILASLSSVYKYTLALYSDSGNLVVLASDEPLVVPYDNIKAAFNNAALKKDFARVGIDSPEALAAHIQMTSDGIKALAKDGKANIDDTNYLEYAVGKTYENKFFAMENHALFEDFMGKPWSAINWDKFDSKQTSALMATIGKEAVLMHSLRHGLAWANQAISLNPTPESFRVAAAAMFEMGNVKEADKLWNVALSLDPNHVNTLRTRAMFIIKLGRIAQAQADLRKALTVDPKNQLARYFFAQTYMPTMVGALAFSSAEGNKPDPLLIGHSAADIQAGCKQVIESLKDLASDEAFYSKNKDTLYMLGVAYYVSGQYDKAADHLKRYLELEPGSILGARLYGTLMMQTGKPRLAAIWWWISFNNATQPEAQCYAQALQAYNDKNMQEAVYSLMRGAELCPGDRRIIDMAEKMAPHNVDAAKLLEQMRPAAPYLR
jgi:spermidine synthase